MGKVLKALNRAAASDTVLNPGEPSPPPLNEQQQPEQSRPTPPAHQQHHLGPAPSPQWDERLAIATAATGPVAESIRSLRTRILHPSSGKPARTLLVTSAAPEEGKSFLCANLAISLAQGLDNHCLLVDCDLRRPMQHTMFGLENTAGLADYLQGEKTIPEILVPSGVDKLSILPSGPLSINPAELLGSSSMASLVDELAQRYDDRIVLLDSPPLQAASETAVLAQQVDGVIVVVRHGASRREHVKALVEAIGRDAIVGVVFNAYSSNLIDTKVFGYYQNYRQYHHHA